MGYFPRSKLQHAVDAALSDDRLEEYLAGDVELAWQKMDRCLQKVDDDEPIFVLRAQDVLAPMVISFWYSYAYKTLTAEHQTEVDAIITAMYKWQYEHFDRLKRPD